MKRIDVRIPGTLVIAAALSLVGPGIARAAEPGTSTHSSPGIQKLYEGYAVSEAVRAGPFLYVGGIVALGEDGKVISPYDGKAQVELIYDRIAKLLAAHGASARNVVSETLYITDWQRYASGAEQRRRFYDDAGAAYPTAVGAEVVSLAEPGLVLEVQLVAYLGE